MVLIWGVNYVVLKAVLAWISPLAFNALRFSLAATTLALLTWLTPGARPARADIIRLLGLGVLGNTIYQFAFIEGLAHTRVGNAALIMAAVPGQTAVIRHFKGHDRLRRRGVAGGAADRVAGRRGGGHLHRHLAHAHMKLVCFDIDGTLLATDGAGRRAIHRALIEELGSAGPIATYHFDGRTDGEIVRHL